MKTLDLKIIVPCSDSYEFLVIADIIRCVAMQNYTKIHLLNGENIVCSCNIGVLKNALLEKGFVDCHKSHLVNKHHIIRYLKEGLVEMCDGSMVPVSRRKKTQFMETIIQHREARYMT